MIQYICSVGNPEGTDWSLIVEHEKEFSREEFQDICEEAIAQTMDAEFKERGYSFISGLDEEKVFEKLQKLGFQAPHQKQVSYYLEPYWGRDHIKSKKLLAAIDRKDK